MTSDPVTRADRVLSGLLVELADAHTPDYLEAAVEHASTQPQRPAWTFPERWIPMELTSTRAGTPRVPWRAIGVLALIGLLLAAISAFYVGTQRRLPEPFGLAANGVVAYDQAGLLYTYDPASGETRALTSIPDRWEAPWFSPDGMTLVMAREHSATQVDFGVMPATGGEIRVVTTKPIEALGTAEFSPDGKTILVDANIDPVPSDADVSVIPTLVAIDLESGTMRTLDVGRPAERPSYRPMDGSQILFASRQGEDTFDIVVADPDGTGATTLFASTSDQLAFDRPRYSQDGSRIAFSIWDDTIDRAIVQIMNADGTGLRPVAPDDIANMAHPVWSPDGRHIAVERWLPDGSSKIAFIDPANGSVSETSMDVSNGAAMEWAPDGSVLFVSPSDGNGEPLPQILVDPATGTFTAAPWPGRSYPSWQRLALPD